MEINISDAELRRRGLFVAESPNVVERALDAGCEPVSLLCDRRHEEAYAQLISRCGNIPARIADEKELREITGFGITRGILCEMRRPKLPSVEDICKGKSRIAVLDGVVDAANVGAIFRSAAALGIGAVLVTSNSCDPLTRRSLRSSMGNVFLVPWTRMDAPLSSLRGLGFRTAAMALSDNSVSIDDDALAAEPKLAIVLGNEGDGLPEETVASADYVVRIPMMPGVDSLNVAASAAIAFWQLRNPRNISPLE